MSVTTQAVILVDYHGIAFGAHGGSNSGSDAGSPLLSHVIDAVVRHGFDDILLLAGHQARAMVDLARHRCHPNVSLRWIIQETALGLGDALCHAEPYLADEFLLVEGDILFDINLNDLVTGPLNPAKARIALRWVPDTARFGRVVLEGDAIRSVQGAGIKGDGLILSGVCFLRKTAINLLPSGASSLENELFPLLIADGTLEGRKYQGLFVQTNAPADHECAERSVRQSLRRPAAFFDRDGVLNEDKDYVSLPGQVTWIDGAKDAIRKLNDEGHYVFVVTNQSGVARGYFDTNRVQALHAWMQQELREAGAHIDAFYFCPHHPDFTGPCDCRKPHPGMILQAMKEWPILKERSFLIGDKRRDVEAAERAGIRGVLFHGGSLLDTLNITLSSPPFGAGL